MSGEFENYIYKSYIDKRNEWEIQLWMDNGNGNATIGRSCHNSLILAIKPTSKFLTMNVCLQL